MQLGVSGEVGCGASAHLNTTLLSAEQLMSAMRPPDALKRTAVTGPECASQVPTSS